MKRYYLCQPSDWPHPIPPDGVDMSEWVKTIPPYTDPENDPRSLLGEAHYMDLSTLGGSKVFLVVVPGTASKVPSTWIQLPHVLSRRTLTSQHISKMGKLTHQVTKADLSPQIGDSTYDFVRRITDGLGHDRFDPEQW